jgi:1,6-anhydro-N-acetylmuramate kinase
VTWWAWVLLWTTLVAGAIGVLLVQARSLWRKAMALFDELGTAADRLGALDQELTTLAERSAAAEELAIFTDPVELRQARAQGRPVRHRPPRHRALPVRPTEPGQATAR